MGDRKIDIRGEVARVHRELRCFRDECLPAFFDSDAARNLPDERTPSHSRWREAADSLLAALPISATGAGHDVPDREDYEPFLFQPVSASSSTNRDGRIAWRIELFVGWDWAIEDLLSRTADTRVQRPDIMEEMRLELPKIRRWIMSLPVDEAFLWNLLCLSLPPIADIDPSFAKLALDPETWRTVVVGDRGIDEETRGRRLAAIDGYFRRVLNNALLHVMGVLANNRFEVIRDLLDHPDLVGGYTALMPHYLFAVLFEKVSVLHGMVREAGVG